MQHKIEYITSEVNISELNKFHNPTKVFEYCKACPNYNKLWSCPPHSFNIDEFITKYKRAKIIGGKVIINKSLINTDRIKEECSEIFLEARKTFSNKLISEETKNSISLIAGNCYKCTSCSRILGIPCIKNNEMRYSLESIGYLVSDITTNILNLDIQWIKNEIPDYMVTVGAMLYEE